MDRQEIEQINNATGTWRQAAGAVRVETFMTPANLGAERTKAIAALQTGRRHDPSFEYPQPESEIDAALLAAAATIDTSHPLAALLATDLARTAEIIAAARARDGARITAVTVAEYGEPSAELVASARQLLDDNQAVPPQVQILDADQVAGELTTALRRSGLDGWSVATELQMSARMSVRAVDAEVRVRADARFSPEEVRRLLVHELGTHVARAENGRSQPLHILGIGVPGYMATEEGLAAWHEQRAGLSDVATMRRYALRVIAADLALHTGFWDVFTEIADHTDAEEAFAIAQRAKRGFTDMRTPGAHVKDHVYLRGLYAIEHHLTENPSDHRLLLSGKFGLDFLPVVRDLDGAGLLVPPAVTPEQFQPTT